MEIFKQLPFENEVFATTEKLFRNTLSFQEFKRCFYSSYNAERIEIATRWLHFFNRLFQTKRVKHYSYCVQAFIHLWQYNSLFHNETTEQHKRAKALFETYFEEINYYSIDPEKNALLLFAFAYCYANYTDQLVNPVHFEPVLVGELVQEKTILNAFQHAFVPYESPQGLLAQLQAMNPLEIDFLMRVVRGENCRNYEVLPIQISQKQLTDLLQFKAVNLNIQNRVLLSMLCAQELLSVQPDFRLFYFFWKILQRNLSNAVLVHIDFWKQALQLVNTANQEIPKINSTWCVEFLVQHAPGFQEKSIQLSGRTPKSFWQLVLNWQHEQQQREFLAIQPWKTQTDEPFEIQVHDTIYKFQELIDAKTLQQEGNELNHCALTYAVKCSKGLCSIFSLKKSDAGKRSFSALITLEVAENKVVQARGAYNRNANAFERFLIDTWCKAKGFELALEKS